MNVLKKTLPQLAFLVDKLGFEAYESMGRTKPDYGTMAIYLRSTLFRLLITREERFVDAWIGSLSDADSWLYLRNVLELVRRRGLDVHQEKPGDPEDLARVLKQAYPVICTLFSREEYENTKRDCEDIGRRVLDEWRAKGWVRQEPPQRV